MNLTFHFKRHVYSVSKVDPLVAQTSTVTTIRRVVADGRTAVHPDKRDAMPKRFVFIQRYRAPLFARSSLFCSSVEQIKASLHDGRNLETRRWLPRGTRARFLLHPVPPPNYFRNQDPVISFLFHANESFSFVDYIATLN